MSHSRYDLLFIRKDPARDDVRIKKNSSFEDMMEAIRWEVFSHDEYKTDPVYLKICESKEDDLCENALYMAADAAGDEKMEKRLKIYYNIATPAECSRLGKLLGVRILPKLPEEYDKNYMVDDPSISFVEFLKLFEEPEAEAMH